MKARNIQLGFVVIALLSGATATAYIRDYNSVTLQARCMAQGNFIQASWNGIQWVQVAN